MGQARNKTYTGTEKTSAYKQKKKQTEKDPVSDGDLAKANAAHCRGGGIWKRGGYLEKRGGEFEQ